MGYDPAYNASSRPRDARDAFGRKVSFGAQWAALDDLLRRLREARNEPGQDAGAERLDAYGFVAASDGFGHPVPIEPFVAERLARGQLTILGAAPGAGKSSLVALTALAINYDRPDLMGERSLDWHGDVVIVSNEDRAPKIRARMDALRREFKLPPKATHGETRIVPAPVTFIAKTRDGLSVTKECERFIEALIGLRKDRPIAAIVVDTLASASEGAEENGTADMQALMNLMGRIAAAAFCAVELIHHVRKSASEADRPLTLSDIRGAGAATASARHVWGIEKFSRSEADAFGWTDTERRARVKVRDLKFEIALPRAFEFSTKSLVAVDPRRPNVPASQTIAFLKPMAWPQVRVADLDDALTALGAWQAQNPGTAIRKSWGGSKTHPNAAKTIIADALGVTSTAAQSAVDDLITRGDLIEFEDRDAHRNKFAAIKVCSKIKHSAGAGEVS